MCVRGHSLGYKWILIWYDSHFYPSGALWNRLNKIKRKLPKRFKERQDTSRNYKSFPLNLTNKMKKLNTFQGIFLHWTHACLFWDTNLFKVWSFPTIVNFLVTLLAVRVDVAYNGKILFIKIGVRKITNRLGWKYKNGSSNCLGSARRHGWLPEGPVSPIELWKHTLAQSVPCTSSMILLKMNCFL